MRPSGLWLPERRLLRPEWRPASDLEIARYGVGGLRRRRLLPRIAGGAGYALVGSVGAISSGTSFTPAWGTSETRAAGNLLVCLAAVSPGGGSLTASAGWLTAINPTATPSQAAIFYKIAAGADAAPTITGGATTSAMVAEFSGGASASPLDQTGSNTTNTATTLTATAGAPDAAPGELVLYAFADDTTLSEAAPTITLNNGASANSSSGGTIHNRVVFGWGITTGNSSADNASTETLTANDGAALVIASFKLPSLAIPPHRARRPAFRGRRPARGRF